ncbi:HET-domain-containing protein, partial [Dichomitus squalens LYAD-421 SS1]
MWLLSTSRAELTHFNNPEDAPGGYAILSHVWDQTGETSFQDMQDIIRRHSPTTNPRDDASAKIRESCRLAERSGLQWIWNDTCCIDKTSSVELSEAINSMFRYYSLSRTCYAYLQDDPDSAFRRSRWHRRGWTLQKLIAPSSLRLLSQSWEELGTKAQLCNLLQEITGVPASILRHEKVPGDFSIAQRMSWAAHRQTTRVEDEAYCLMGIFDIGMPVLYGEGTRAFRRVQEEIMKFSMDPTLFAW